MTDQVPVSNRRIRYTVTNPAGQSVFAVPFPVSILKDEDGLDVVPLRVFVDNVETVDFTFDVETDELTLDDDALQDSVVVIEGARPIRRQSGYQLRGGLPSSQLNFDINALIEMLQELRRDQLRSLILARSESDSVTAQLPALSSGHVLQWGDEGIENGPLMTDIEAVAQHLDEIDALSPIVTQITTLAAMDEELLALYAIRVAIAAVGAIDGQVVIVANRDADIGTVAARDGDIGTVADRDLDIGTVADRDLDIGIVADRDADIAAVALKLTEIEACAAALVAIEAAPDAALLAARYANEDEDVEVETGFYSAFHWAMKAQAFASGAADNISFDDTGLTYVLGADVQAALEAADAVLEGKAALSQTNSMAVAVASAKDETYIVQLKAPHGGTITETTTKCASGTCTMTFKINGTPLGGTANAVSSSEQSQAHTTANVFAAGDDIEVTISANASCKKAFGTIKYTQVFNA